MGEKKVSRFPGRISRGASNLSGTQIPRNNQRQCMPCLASGCSRDPPQESHGGPLPNMSRC